jgi:hypothetical protein
MRVTQGLRTLSLVCLSTRRVVRIAVQRSKMLSAAAAFVTETGSVEAEKIDLQRATVEAP